MHKKGSFFGVLLLFILLVALGFSLYFLIESFPTDPVAFRRVNPFGQSETIEYATSDQFYENMRFPTRDIGYRVESQCGSRENEVERAFAQLNQQTVLTFYKTNQDPQIEIVCSALPNEPAINEGYFVAGEGGPTQVINTSLYAVILEGKVALFREEQCDDPKIALHEILHVLGFDHNQNPTSILYPTLDCDQALDSEIVSDINSLYTQPGAADLKIESVSAEKTGRYLNFEIEVVNQGLLPTQNAELAVYHDGTRVLFEGDADTLLLGNLDVGTKKILTVTNARVDRSTQQITFSVDPINSIEELYENNNEIVLTLESQ